MTETELADEFEMYAKGAAGVMMFDGAEAGPVPAALIARTVKL
jgi:hypothetical protein